MNEITGVADLADVSEWPTGQQSRQHALLQRSYVAECADSETCHEREAYNVEQRQTAAGTEGAICK
jgi:hypothetical protein